MFDGFVFINNIPPDDSNVSAFCFFTRPFDLAKIQPRTTIYTTALLKSAMICDDPNIRQNIEILSDCGFSYGIELPNQETLVVKAFSCGCNTLNVILLFEYKDRFSLYAGRFISNGTILKYDCFRQLCLQNSIDDLYIDCRAAHIQRFNLRKQAVQKIVSIVKNCETGHKFHMLIDDFGYEDLVFALAKLGVRICFSESMRVQTFKRHQDFDLLDFNKNDADIILKDHLPTQFEIEKQFELQKIISIKFKLSSDDDDESSEALRIINFSVYPALSDIHYLAHLMASKNIYPIEETTCLPFDLSELCQGRKMGSKACI